MNTLKLRKLALIFSVCLVTACAPPKVAPELSAENKQPPTEGQLSADGKTKKLASTISSWEISGAMSAKNKNKGWSASLNWLQQGANQYQIRLFGPLGGGTVIIEKKGAVITYVDGPKKIASHSADELLQQQTGIRLPVHSLYYWVRGLPSPGAVQSTQYDPNGHLASLKQGGYTINYASYTSISNVDLPSRIQLYGHGVVVKLAIKNWKV